MKTLGTYGHMTAKQDQSLEQTDIYWKVLDDCIQRLGELAISDELLKTTPGEDQLLESWESIRKWRSEGVPGKYRRYLIELYATQVLAMETEVGFEAQTTDASLRFSIKSGMTESDYLKLLERCIQSLGQQKVSYWSLIDWGKVRQWHLEGVPEEVQESVMGLQESILTGLENEFRDDDNDTEIVTFPTKTAANRFEGIQSEGLENKPQLQLYRETYANFYEDILEQDVKAIFDAEEAMAYSNLSIGQQIYRVRAILNVYGQRKFLEWLKGICCKICNISWRKAYDLMHAYESRRFVERSRPDLLPIFDYQLQRFQCEARRFKPGLVAILEEAKVSNKRFTLEEVKEIFPPEKERPPEDPHTSELRMSLRKLLDDSLISDLTRYIQNHPGESFQSILEVALRSWLTQQA